MAVSYFACERACEATWRSLIAQHACHEKPPVAAAVVLTAFAALLEPLASTRPGSEPVAVIIGDTIRLVASASGCVGLDAPESFHSRCEPELVAGLKANERLSGLIELVTSLELKERPRGTVRRARPSPSQCRHWGIAAEVIRPSRRTHEVRMTWPMPQRRGGAALFRLSVTATTAISARRRASPFATFGVSAPNSDATSKASGRVTIVGGYVSGLVARSKL